jgi:CarboxypepD_reg-like domain
LLIALQQLVLAIFMKKIFALLIFNLFALLAQAQGYLVISGKVIDQQTQQPIAHAYLGILGKGTGTIANDQGEFVFRFPRITADSALVVAVAGYRTFRQKAADFQASPKNVVIALIPAKPQVIDSTFMKRFDARTLVYAALKKINKMNPEQPYLLSGFYQETLQKDNEYVEIKEAILQAEKDPRPKTLLPEKIKAIRSRKFVSENIPKMFEGYGFPNGATIVGHSIDTGIPDYWEGNRLYDYNYQLDDTIAYYLDKSVYRVRFWPGNGNVRAARKGIVTINSADSAIVSIEYELLEEGVKDIFKTGMKDKVFGKTKREPKRLYAKVNYKPLGGRWYLQDYQIVLDTQFEQNKIQTMGTIRLHFATTEILKSNGLRIAEEDLLLSTDDWVAHTIPKYDELLWGNANFVLPTAAMRQILATLQK